MKLILAGVIAISLLAACSGGGGGSGSGSGGGGEGGGGGTPEFEREQIFSDEALMRAVDQIIVACDMVSCMHASNENFWITHDDTLMNKTCSYRCVEVDYDGELRHYIVLVGWQQLVGLCFTDIERRDIWIVENPEPCIPNF